MRDFLLDDGFLQSCIHLPGEIRRKIASQLHAFAAHPRDRDLGVARVEGSRHVLSLPVDNTFSIILHRKKPVTTLLFVTEDISTPASPVSKRGMRRDHLVVAPVDAIEALLVEEKYLLFAKHLLGTAAAIRELQFKVSEIETILNAHLPPEARRFPNWWANQKSGKRAHAFAWMAAGWLVSKVDFNSGLVKFIRRNAEADGES